MLKLPIDHIGILAPEIAPLVDEFQRLGFKVVGPKELTAVDADGKLQGLGQYSAHVMFADNYIELTAVEKPTADHHLASFLSPPWGVRLVLLGTDDIHLSRAVCTNNGLRPYPPQAAARELDYLNGVSARFEWFGLPHDDWPECLLAYVQHHHREQIFSAQVSEHPNGALGLKHLSFNGTVPKRFLKLAGDQESSTDKQQRLVELRDSIDKTDGLENASTTPFFRIGIDVANLAATTRLLSDAGFKPDRGECEVSLRLQSGVVICFQQDTCI